MDGHELALLCAHIIKAQCGRDVALLVRVDTGQAVGWAAAGEGGPTRGQSCCTEAFRAKAETGFPAADLLIYTTVKPTVMCLGMGIRGHARAYVFVNNGQISFLECADLNLAPRVTAGALPAVALPWLAAFAGTAMAIGVSKGSIVHAIRHGNTDTLKIYYNELTRQVRDGGWWLHEAVSQQLASPTPPLFNMPALQADCGPPATALRHRLYMLLTSTLLHVIRVRADPKLDGKYVSCVLLGPMGRILSWAVNNNTGNTTRHAETNCLLSFLAQSDVDVPAGSFLYTSLESCEMCAGMLATVAPRVTVIFATPDPGIGDTALRQGLNQTTQQRYNGPSANPIVRKKFQNLVYRAVAQKRADDLQPLLDRIPAHYVHLNPPPVIAHLDNRQKGLAMKAYNNQKNLGIAQEKALWRARRIDPIMNKVENLPQSITSALDKPSVAAAFGVYAEEFFSYAADMITVWINRDIVPVQDDMPPLQDVQSVRDRRPEMINLTHFDMLALLNCLTVLHVALERPTR